MSYFKDIEFLQQQQQKKPKIINQPIKQEEPKKGALQSFKDEFILQNTITSTLNNALSNNIEDQEEDINYDIGGKLIGTKYEPYADSFIGKVYNDAQFNNIATKIDKELELRENNDPVWGTIGAIAGGVLDPINLIPIGGTAYKTFKTGKTLKGAIRGAEVGFLSEAATETVLQSQQETRTIQETTINLAGGAILGGVIGGAAASLSRGDFDNVARRMGNDMQRTESQIEIDNDGNLSAAKVERNNFGENDLAGGKVSQAVIKSTAKLNPMLRVLQSSSEKAKEILPSLVRTNMYFKKNFDDIATDQSIEIAIKSYDAGLGASIEGGKKTYKALNKRLKNQGEKPVSIDNFYDQVSLAMIRGDKSNIPEVEQAAKLYRSQVFDPLLNRGVEVGLLSEELKKVPSKTAVSYLTRKYDIRKMVAREKEFKDIVRTAARERLMPQIREQLGKPEIKDIPKLKKQLADIEAKIAGTKEFKEGEFVKLYDKKMELVVRLNDQAEVDKYIETIVSDVFNKIRGTETKGISMPYDLTVTERGPAKERTLLFVQDEEIREFLDKDITNIAKSYTKTIGTDVEIKAKFGDLNLKEQLDDISKEYEALRGKTKTEKERLKLDDEEAEVRRIISSLKDVLRGNYGRPNNPDSFFIKAMQASRTINYMSKLGGVTVSSIPDMGRHVMVHGINRVFGKGLKTLITNTKAIKLSTKDARFSGQLWEAVTHQRASLMADLGNPYSGESKFMTMLSYMGQNFSKINFLDAWNNAQKGFSSILTQSRIIENVRNFDKLKPKEKVYMNFLGIDKPTAVKLKNQLDKYSFDQDGFPIANLEKWTDDDALRIYKNALNTDVDRTIVTKGVGDVPLLMNTELGKTIFQFKSFAFAAHQQVTIAGLQQADMAAITGITTMLGLGMLTYHLKALAAGRETSNDPRVWVAEGWDRSGLTPAIAEINGVADLMGFGAGRIMGQEPLSRFASRNQLSGFIGPSFGQIQDVTTISKAISNGEMQEADIKAIRRNLPFQNVFYIRWLLDNLEENINN